MVYLARLEDQSTVTKDQPFFAAMKVIKLSDDDLEKKYQRREFEFFSYTLKQGIHEHKNIIRYFSFVDYERSKSHCVFMELCQQTLREAMLGAAVEIEEERRAFVKHVTLGICRGVNHLHKHGIIHRDISPENILMKYESDSADMHTRWQVKVADLNLHTIHEPDVKESHSVNIGQSKYRANEVRAPKLGHCRATYGSPVDVWSIGAVIYELDSRDVFMNLSKSEIYDQQLFNTERKIKMKIRDSQLRSFLTMCLQWEPVDRRSCSELLRHDFLLSALELDPIDDEEQLSPETQ